MPAEVKQVSLPVFSLFSHLHFQPLGPINTLWPSLFAFSRIDLILMLGQRLYDAVSMWFGGMTRRHVYM